MMTQDRDYEDVLRRALTAAAESIEPAGDGLQHIRHRLDSPRSPRFVLSGCAEWLELHWTRFLVRLEPATEAGRTLLGRTGPLLALAGFLHGLLRPARGRRAGGHRGPASSPGRLGPAGAWLRPVLAVSAAVAIVVVGVVILDHKTGTLIGPAGQNSNSSQHSGGGRSGTASHSKHLKTQPNPIGVSPSPTPSGSERSTTRQRSTPETAAPTATAATAPAESTSPSASPTAADTPSPTPTPTGEPTPSPTSTSTPGSGSTTSASTAALVIREDAGVVVQRGADPETPQAS